MRHLRSWILVSATALVAWGLVTACGGSEDSGTRRNDAGSSYDYDSGYNYDPDDDYNNNNYNTYDSGFGYSNSPGRIPCGYTECTAQSQVCCMGTDGGTCQNPGDVCGPLGLGQKLPCDDQSDCPSGQKCCAGLFGVACAADCNFFTPVQLCAQTLECGDAGACTEKTCINWTNFTSYRTRTCGAVPPGCK